jgi:hypothetical protein
MGTTRNDESIYKLIWNGDRQVLVRVLHVLGCSREAHVRTDAAAEDPLQGFAGSDHPQADQRRVSRRGGYCSHASSPSSTPTPGRPESWVWDPNLKRKKQIRPDVPPEVFWVWYATIGAHNGTCCAVKQKNWDKCFGAYAPPQFAEGLLGIQKRADAAGGTRSVYEKVDPTFVSEVEDENNGYLLEMAEMEVEEQIYTENPLALIGVHASLKAGLDDPQRARQFVKDYYDRQKQELAKKL